MKTYGIVMELNPFHNGHQYFLNEIKKIAADNYVVAIISTETVQRGEFSVLSTKTKTEILLENNIDLVIALPFIYTNQGGEFFGFHSVDILNKFGIDELICGSESADLEKIKTKYDNQEDNKDFKKGYLKEELLGFEANDILGLSYYRAIQKVNPEIKLKLIKRIAYKDQKQEKIIVSASEIRRIVKKDQVDFSNREQKILEQGLEAEVLNEVKLINEFKVFNLFKYQLVVNQDLNNQDIFLSESGQLIQKINKIINKNKKLQTLEELANFGRDKNNSRYKIQRIALNLLFQLTKDRYNKIINQKNSYYVLGFNKRISQRLKKNPYFFTNFKYDNELYYLDQKVLKVKEQLSREFEVEKIWKHSIIKE